LIIRLKLLTIKKYGGGAIINRRITAIAILIAFILQSASVKAAQECPEETLHIYEFESRETVSGYVTLPFQSLNDTLPLQSINETLSPQSLNETLSPQSLNAHSADTVYIPINNASTTAFPRWERTINSYLVSKKDNSFDVVTFMKKNVRIESYNYNYELIGQKEISAELPIIGAFCSGQDYNYIAYGQTNFLERNSREVVRIVKYDKDFNRIDSVSITGMQSFTIAPFDSSSARMAEDGSTLALHMGRLRYATPNGENHQSQFTIVIDISSMDIINDLGEYQSNHVSHSFNQFVLFDKSKHVLLDHGDAYPRSIVLKKSDGSGYSSINLFRIPGPLGVNTTGVSIGGFEMTSHSYVAAINSIKHERVIEYNPYNILGVDPNRRDIILCTLPKNAYYEKDVNQTTIASYTEGRLKATKPKLVKINDDELLVIWQEYLIGSNTPQAVKYVQVNNGSDIGCVQSLDGLRLSECQPLAVNGKVVWFTDENGYRTFYDIDIVTQS